MSSVNAAGKVAIARLVAALLAGVGAGASTTVVSTAPPLSDTYVCTDVTPCLGEGSCEGIAYSLSEQCTLQCWAAGEGEGEITAGAAVECSDHE